MSRLIVGASLGNCVHVGGVLNFLKLAESRGYKTRFLGPAVSIKYLLDAIEEADPELVAVSYRLTPETAARLFKSLQQSLCERGLTDYKFLFGGTLPVAREAARVGIFDEIFTGEESREEIIAFLEGKDPDKASRELGDNLLDRIELKAPYPLLRHHYGQPDLEQTVKGIREIAESGVIDVISLGPDQNAQESFFRPQEMDEEQKGAGGVPLRTREDLERLYQASRRGNYPLMRSYSGTRDVFRMARLLQETIRNAWAAIPLSWYNQLDGRGPRPLLESIRENQRLMAWHGQRGIPVEVNEAHHWSLRDAHDTVAVVMAYLAAYNARAMGVKTYIAQYMFNNPAPTTAAMDIAKMLAKKELIEDLMGSEFQVLTQVRAGLASFPPDPEQARGQLAFSTFLGMALKPEIVHVVGYSEADHAARSDEVIASIKIARQVINNSLDGYPDLTRDPAVRQRKRELMEESRVLLDSLQQLADSDVNDPWQDPRVLARAIEMGLIDAPHLQGNPAGVGRLQTRMIDGACYAYDYEQEKVLGERERINRLCPIC